MAKNSPGTLNSRTVRISLRTYLLLKELSEHTGLSMAEVLDKLITSRTQILTPVTAARSMPVTSIKARSTLVTAARSMPITIARARSTPVTIGFAREV